MAEHLFERPHRDRSRSTRVRRRVVCADRAGRYDVRLVHDLADGPAASLIERVADRRALIVSTPTVDRLYARRIHRVLRQANPTTGLHVLACDEAGKSLEQVASLCETAADHGLDRRAVIVGIGGGVCTDLVTMSAAWLRRGIDYIRVPTTLIGQIDAGIGIKGAVNFGDRKSFLGTFHPPDSVLIDPAFLATLTDRHVRCGLSEIIKIAVVADRPLFEMVEHSWPAFFLPDQKSRRASHQTVWRSVVSLLDVLESNLFENRSYERLADFGHTFSPALESASEFQVHHGEAVAIDMALSTEISRLLGLLADRDADRIVQLLHSIGLPAYHPLLTDELCTRSIVEAAHHRGGAPNLVLPTGIGGATFARQVGDVPPSILRRALRAVARGCGVQSDA